MAPEDSNEHTRDGVRNRLAYNANREVKTDRALGEWGAEEDGDKRLRKV